MYKLSTQGLISAGASFFILQLSFLKPTWGKPLGAAALVLGLMAIVLGIAQLVRAIRSKAFGLTSLLLIILVVLLGAIFGFYGLFVLIMS